MNKNDDNLNIFSDDENNSLSIEEIIEQDKADKAEEDLLLNKGKGKDKAKKIGLICGGGVLAIALVVGIVTFNPFDGNKDSFGNDDPLGSYQGQPGEDEKPKDDKKEETKPKADEDLIKDDESFAKEDNTYPIETKDWELTSYKNSKAADRKANILKKHAESEFVSESNILPSEESGYTSDDKKQTLSDGTLNPFYSYWTAEKYQSEVGEMLERLINPSYGGWGVYQYSGYGGKDSFDIGLVQDMFTDNWVLKNQDKKSSEYIPVFADWEGNDYGMDNQLISGSRWIGEVESSVSEFVYDEKTLQYNVKLVADIKYTAWAKDQSKLEKNATLTLNLVPNTGDNTNGKSSYRVLIEDADLKVEG